MSTQTFDTPTNDTIASAAAQKSSDTLSGDDRGAAIVTVWIQNDVGHYIQQAIRNFYDPTKLQILHTTLGMIPPNATSQQWEHDLKYMRDTPGTLYWTKVPLWHKPPAGMMPYLISMVQLAKKNGSQIILDITDIVQRSHKSNTISTRD